MKKSTKTALIRDEINIIWFWNNQKSITNQLSACLAKQVWKWDTINVWRLPSYNPTKYSNKNDCMTTIKIAYINKRRKNYTNWVLQHSNIPFAYQFSAWFGKVQISMAKRGFVVRMHGKYQTSINKSKEVNFMWFEFWRTQKFRLLTYL